MSTFDDCLCEMMYQWLRKPGYSWEITAMKVLLYVSVIKGLHIKGTQSPTYRPLMAVLVRGHSDAKWWNCATRLSSLTAVYFLYFTFVSWLFTMLFTCCTSATLHVMNMQSKIIYKTRSHYFLRRHVRSTWKLDRFAHARYSWLCAFNVRELKP